MKNAAAFQARTANFRNGNLIVVVSALCADFEPQARRYKKSGINYPEP